MTKGQVEALISEAISKFEIEHMGRGPKQIKTYILQDLIIIRLTGFLSVSEKTLAKSKEGIELIKKVRAALFETSKDKIEDMIKSIINVEIISTFSDVNIDSGEKVIVITVNENIEKII